jgi:ParB family chromosome partitioning protein
LAKNDVRNSIKLASVDELFSTEESRTDSQREKVLDIPLSEISDFPDHPFKVKADEAMLEMADSVKQYGVLVPGLVRPKADGGYEMVAGHRRKKASELAGKETMPCIVRDLDNDAATIIMVDSNLQRESILPSEKAFAYKMKLEAMKRQAGRPSKENSTQVGQDLKGKYSVEILGEQVGESRNQIQRYIRLTELIPSLVEMLDEKQVAFNPAVEISYLPENEQQDLYNTMQSEECTPSLAQAQRMKKLSQEGRLNVDVIFSILTEEKPNQKEKFNIQRERIDRFFPRGFSEKQKEDLIVQLLESWYKKRQREQER